MSGALNSVFKGGNLFGALMSIASIAFPPMALATSMSNLLTSAIGQAVKLATETLVKEFAMPRFLQPIVNQIVDGIVTNLQANNPTDPAADQVVAERMSGTAENITRDLTQQLVEQTVKNIEKNKRSAGVKSSAGSWLEAIAVALGTVQGEKAAKLVQLADELSNISGRQTSGSQSSQAQNAQQFSIKSQQLQAVSQEMSLLSNATSNAIKSIGEALSQAARKG